MQLFLPLYIDPGTGSMLFSLFIGVAAAATFGIRALFLKLKFIFSGGKAGQNENGNNIPYVIFSDHKRYWNVFKPICDEFEKREIDLVYYTCSPDDPALTAGYKHVRAEYLGEKNKPYAKLNFLRADILMATTPNLDVYQWKRSKNVRCYVHIPHTVDDLAGYRMFGLDYYDALLASGENQEKFARRIESVRPTIAKKEIALVGSLPLDNLKQKYDSARRVENSNKIVLVAPSWGKSGILSRYGERFLEALSRTGFKIIVRPHPQTVVSEQAILKPLEERFTGFEWNYDNDNFEVLNKADILITDFSGIIFDYSLVFNKPVIYADTNFDTLPYDADWFEEKIWALRAVESLGIQLKESDFDNMKTVIERALGSDNLAKARTDIRNECWVSIGDAAKNVTDWVLQKHMEFEI